MNYMASAVVAAAIFGLGVAHADIPIDKTLPARPDGSLRVENVKGNVTIEGWDRDEVHVTGRQGGGVERIDYESKGGNVSIKVVYPKRTSVTSDTVLDIMAPFGNEVDVSVVSSRVTVTGMTDSVTVKGVSSKIEITGAEGAVAAQTVSGAIEIDAPAPDVTASTVSGSIRIDNAMGDVQTETVSGSTRIAGNHLGDVECESISGGIDVSGTFDGNGELNLETHSGRVEIQGGPIDELEAETMSGSIKADIHPAADGDISLTSFSGGVHLVVPAATQAEYDLEAFSARVEVSNLSVNLDEAQRGRNFSFTIGDDPDLEIEVRSFSGRVKVEGRAE